MMLCSLVPVALVLVLLNSIKAHTQRFNSAGEGLRLIKTSESANGTWYTEQEKLDLFISNPARAQFVDITEPQVCTCVDNIKAVSHHDTETQRSPHHARQRLQNRQTTGWVFPGGGDVQLDRHAVDLGYQL
jgi:hypothetical protein